MLWSCGKPYIMSKGHVNTIKTVVYADENPGFIDPATGDVRLRADAPLFARLGFRPIPIEEIGLYRDECRATWPVTSTPAEVADWRTLSIGAGG